MCNAYEVMIPFTKSSLDVLDSLQSFYLFREGTLGVALQVVPFDMSALLRQELADSCTVQGYLGRDVFML